MGGIRHWVREARAIGGERQRVALARAGQWFNRPSLLLLDESLGAGRSFGTKSFLEFAEHFPNQTIVFISHRISLLNGLTILLY